MADRGVFQGKLFFDRSRLAEQFMSEEDAPRRNVRFINIPAATARDLGLKAFLVYQTDGGPVRPVHVLSNWEQNLERMAENLSFHYQACIEANHMPIDALMIRDAVVYDIIVWLMAEALEADCTCPVVLQHIKTIWHRTARVDAVMVEYHRTDPLPITGLS